jgi:hypothetical protein
MLPGVRAIRAAASPVVSGTAAISAMQPTAVAIAGSAIACVLRASTAVMRRLPTMSSYLQGIDNTEIIDTVHSRRAPMVPVHSSLRA